MAEPSTAIDRKAILTLRRRVRFQDGRPYDARCSKVAPALEAQFGCPRRWGRLRLLDATADQPAPPWTFTLREQEEVIELAAVQDGAEGHEAAMPCASWMAAARQVL